MFRIVLIIIFVSQVSTVLADMRADSLLLTGARSKNVGMIELALSRGAELNSKDELGRTPLIWASFHGEIKIMDILWKEGAKLDEQDSMGRTALMWSALSGRLKAIEFLIAKGANFKMLDSKGLSAAEWALREGHEDISNALLQYEN